MRIMFLIPFIFIYAIVDFGLYAQDTLRYPINPTHDPTQTQTQSFDLGDPSSVQQTIVYDPVTGTYVFKETIGASGMDYRPPSMMTLEEYLEYERQKSIRDNWKDKIDQQTADSQPFALPINIDNKLFKSFFGSDQITIRPQGTVEIGLGVNSSRYDNPLLPVQQRRITRFDFNQNINFNVVGQIGTRLKLGMSYNTQANFEFDNVTKLEYNGDEDQIVQSIALGNVSLDLPTTLIPSSKTLFGASTKLRFGKTTVDLIAASSKGQRKEIQVEGGAQKQKFELTADQYEANRHYFLNFYHRNNYDEAMKALPIVNSGVNISRIEVWVTNRTNTTENTRNIVAFTDLGEGLPENAEGTPGGFSNNALPDNTANGLYQWVSSQPGIRDFSSSVSVLTSQVVTPGPFVQAIHYEKVESAKKLNDAEFTYNAQLGFISLNIPLNNDEVLAVAYEYTYRGQTYQIGELSTDGVEGTNSLILKLLKPTMTDPKNKLWDLMMKNVYSLGAYQVDQVGFRLDILYNNPDNSLNIPFFPYEGLEDKQIVTMLEMDKLNQMHQPFSDGVFDYVPMTQSGNRFENGGTINPRNGRVYFSTIEPFGRLLASKMAEVNVPQTTIDQIAFTELYDSTKTAAQQIPSKNRFSFAGEYQSSVTGDIPLNALNVPEGAVSVTAGGVRLQEGVDYTVDYNLGRVRILNEGLLASNQRINVSVESNSAFGFQSKSLIGSRVSHRFSQDLNVGATWMRMMERPVTQKIDIGNEPYKNNIVGFDVQYRTELPFLTKLIDMLPVISTKEKSSLSFSGEFAHLIPGQPRAISKAGISYVDDFEGAQSTIDLTSLNAWHLASLPLGQPSLFPESTSIGLSKAFRRSKIAWYRIDFLFYRQDANTPSHIANDPLVNSDSRTRNVHYQDVFPLQENQYGAIPNLQILEVAYYPKERGMYNYDTTNFVDSDGLFTNPQDRWGGIMRAMTTTDFELANIEYIQFWVLDPFNEDAENQNPGFMSGGDLYFNLGNISEDILPDSRKSYENGLSPSGTPGPNDMDTTLWAQIPNAQVTVNAFDNNPQSRINQDVGLDGFNNAAERIHFANYINWVNNNSTLSAAAKSRMIADPSSDDYNYYLDDNYDQQELGILDRYKKYNGMEGNSPTPEMYDTMNTNGYSTMGPRLDPDREDINQDNNLQETENYFQYKVSLRPQHMVVGTNYIANKQTFTKGNGAKEDWYQFKIPVRDFSDRINGISDFRSIRFMRMFLKDFDEEVLLRFAKLELVRGEWRRFTQNLSQPGEGVVTDPNLTSFDIGAVNVQENSDRAPINYVIPPGIQREIDPSQQITRQMNEQALTLEVCGLQDGDSRAAVKNVTFDVRGYKKLKMFAHAESMVDQIPIDDDDLTVFVRLGTDFTENYYEYELPLKVTQFGAKLDTDVWPEENNIEIIFDDLIDLKKKRNNLIESGNTGVSYNLEYSAPDPNYPNKRIKVKGNPNLQGLRTIMIGVRNPRNNAANPWQDDGMAHCGIVWVNELRLTDFVSEGGSAAIAQLQIQGADFFNISASGSYSGYNWGAVDSRVQERQRDQRLNANFNSNWQLGQFFGRRFGLSLPFFFGYSVGVINPEFDPYNPDIKLSDYDDASERRRRAREGQDFTERISYNFTNVRKQLAPGAKPAFWRIANWSASYAYSEDLRRDFNIKFDRTKLWTGNLNYNYSFQAKPWEPFKNVFKKDKFKKSKWLALVRDANIYYLPKNFSFSNDILRSYNERQVKNNIVPDYEFPAVYIKRFTWNRSYNLGYDITKNLKLTFTANNRAIFEEADGQVDRKESPDLYREFKDSIRTQMATFGKTTDYMHNYNINYTLPLNKIPALDWTTATVAYGGTYNWQRAPLSQAEFGNTVQNNRTINAQTQLNFTNLYNKLPFFKKVLADGKTQRGAASTRSRATTDGSSGNNTSSSKQTKKEPSIEEKYPKPVPPKPEEDMTEKEKKKWEKVIKRWEKKVERARKRKEKNKVHPVAGFAARLVMSLRNVGATYSQNDGTLLPGYGRETRIMGFDSGFDAPMSGFIFGKQRYDVTGKDTGFDFARTAAENGWLVQNENINRQYTNTHVQNITIRAGLEPMKDLTIEFTANRTYGNNSTEFFRWNSMTNSYEGQSRVDISQLTYTNVSVGSAFAALGGSDYSSEVFQKLLDSRKDVSTLLGQQNANSSQLGSGYYSGYNGSHQEVLIGAFLTSYTNRTVNEKNINPVKNLPLPNWSVNYNGLSKMEFMKKYARQFVIKHAYNSTVSISGMQTNLNAAFDAAGNPTALDINNNYISERQIQNVTMSERFSPLIGFDATWTVKQQGLITKFEISKDRSATLSLNNNQVTEVLGTTYVIGTGYRFPKVRLPIKNLAPSDMNFRFDFSLRDNLTVIRKIVENTNQATAGQKVMSIKASLDYSVGKFLILQLYYDQVVNTPKIATSYPTGNMSTGIKLRYNLAGVQ